MKIKMQCKTGQSKVYRLYNSKGRAFASIRVGKVWPSQKGPYCQIKMHPIPKPAVIH